MTPAEQKARDLARAHIFDPSREGQQYSESDLKRISDFEAGFKAALDLGYSALLDKNIKSLSKLQYKKQGIKEAYYNRGVMDCINHLNNPLRFWRMFIGEDK